MMFSQGKLTNCHASGCERPFSVQKIPHSNLILLVVDMKCMCGSKQLDVSQQEVPNGAGKLQFGVETLLFLREQWL